MVLSDHEAHSVEVADIAELSVAILEVAGVCSDEGPDDYWECGSIFRFGCAGCRGLTFAFGFTCHGGSYWNSKSAVSLEQQHRSASKGAL